MNRLERIKEIIKASPDFGKRVGYKMCIVDELHDVKEQFEKEAIKNTSFNYALTLIQDLLDNSDEYVRERAINFLKEVDIDLS